MKHLTVKRAALMALCLVAALASWCAPVPATPELPPDSIRVSLVTFAPGSDNYELFGHAELRVIDRTFATAVNPRGDWYFNYGVFDFETPGFFWRFALGDCDYLCMPLPPSLVTIDNEGRKMTEYVLNLRHDEARKLSQYLAWNALPANREYRYRYFSDNCATRPRDIVENALNGTLHYGDIATVGRETTFREVLRHYTANYPWEQFGIDLLMGAPCDTLITARQAMFVPMLLGEAMAGATVQRSGESGASGEGEPLVAATQVLIDGPDEGTVLPPTPWYFSPLALMIVVLVASIAVTVLQRRRPRLARRFDAIFFAALSVMALVVCFVSFFSSHEATWPNYNVLWLSPLLFVLAVAPWRKHRGRVVRYTAIAVAALTLTTMLIWLSRLQCPNAAFWPLAVATVLRADAYVRNSSF